ncbi:MAG: molecular chaperone DnaK, partial [Methyloligellaceae bacterium]
VEELGDKVSESDKSAVEAAAASLQAALDEKDADNNEDIKAKTETLAQAAMKLGEAMYQNAGDTGGESEPGAASSEKDDDVVDADFEEVKDDKKSS